jgi:hypothetical protein
METADFSAIEARLDRIERMLSRLIGQAAPGPVTDHDRLVTLARLDRDAAIAEAKRIAAEDTAQRARGAR